MCQYITQVKWLLSFFFHPSFSLQAELEDLVKKEHARIDSEDKKEKSSEKKEGAAKASSASVAPEPKKEE